MLWTGGYSGCDHCWGAGAQVYQVVLCCLIQDLKKNECISNKMIVSKVLKGSSAGIRER